MKIEIIDRTEHTRKPTAKRVYKTRFNYCNKVKHATRIICYEYIFYF